MPTCNRGAHLIDFLLIVSTILTAYFIEIGAFSFSPTPPSDES